MNSLEIRQKFFDFFSKFQHTIVPSSSLIPAQDPTLLFANAGMNQFKDCFLGKENRSYKRAVTIQKCIRAGGKHNDLENVGFTKRHLTFFEMMGNFSFGDYFKKEAISFAWDFLTKEIGLDSEKLYASVFREDQEAYDIWLKSIGLPSNRIIKLGEADNFWQMGDTGPCGPCSEIYFDRGLSFGCKKEDCLPGCSCDRFLEIWNLVFMQFDRQPNGKDILLSQTGVDTGMGLERLMVVVQNKDSVYETDIFAPLLAGIEELSGVSYDQAPQDIKTAFCVLADHIRSASFAIADGCMPSNEGRGYVLRKIIRRAALFSQKISDKNIFPELIQFLVLSMGKIYPELIAQQKLIIALLENETEKFALNLIHGQELLKKYVKESVDQRTLSGENAFKLYDTYGFPIEITKVIVQESNYTVDIPGFEKQMEIQRAQSGKKQKAVFAALPSNIITLFTGYTELITEAKIIALLVDNELVDQVEKNKTCWVITDKSPFYVECGGQVSDQAKIFINTVPAAVNNLKKIDKAIAAEIITPFQICIGDTVMQSVDSQSRIDSMKNHTATHLLQAALVSVFGKSIKQAGSLVVPDYLRFDFSYHESITAEQLMAIELIVNQKIRENIITEITTTTYNNAIGQGVTAFFGDKYNPDNVRVVTIPGFSAELCGGTHVRATGDIGCFKIIEFSSLSVGVKRIVALTGQKAIELYLESFALSKHLSQEFKVKPNFVFDAVKKLKDQTKMLQFEVKALKKELLQSQIPSLIQNIPLIGSLPLLIHTFSTATLEELKEIAGDLIKRKSGFYLLFGGQGEKLFCFGLVSADCKISFSLQDFSLFLSEQYSFKGGTNKNSFYGSCRKINQELIRDWFLKNNN